MLAGSLLMLASCGKSSPLDTDADGSGADQQTVESANTVQSITVSVPTANTSSLPSFGAALPAVPTDLETLVMSVDSTESAAPPLGAVSELKPDNEPQTVAEPELPANEPEPTAEPLLSFTANEPKPDAKPLPPSAANGAAFCEGLFSNADSVVVPPLSKTDYLQQYSDQVFGALVTRITDGVFGEVNKPAYSTMQAWNADESLLMLYRTGVSGAGHKLHNGHTYEFIQDLDISPSDLEQVFWSRTNPDVFFYISKRSGDYGKLKQFNVSRNQSFELADFSAQCGSNLPHAGNDVQMHALNDDLFGFTCQQEDGGQIMFSYRLSTNDIVTTPVGSGTRWQSGSAPAVAASGNRFWHQGAVIDADLSTVNFELDLGNAQEHSSMGETHDGQDAYYQVSFNASPNGCNGDLYSGVGHLVEHNLETGECRNIISQEQGYPYTTSSTHVSALAIDKPERVAMSSIGRSSQLPLFTNGLAAPALFSEIYLAQTTPDDTVVCRLAHHRSYGKSATNGGYEPYFGEPHATISPSGTRILFGSDWYDSGTVDSYVVELPDYSAP